jgi:polysaccharide export outer membrane protein
MATEAQRQGNRIYELTTLDVRLRLLSELARLARHGVAQGSRVRIDPAPTHDSLASQIGSSREGVTRYIREFVQRGWIEVPRRRRIEITNLSTLQSILARHNVSETPKPNPPIWASAGRQVKTAVMALLAFGYLGFCARSEAAPIPDSCETAYSSADGAKTTSQEYTLAPGDKVHITVYDEPDLTRDVLVNADGKISFPLIGEVAVTGVTLNALTKDITAGLQTYLRDARVAAEIAEYRPFYIYGEVNSPGNYPYSASLTVIGAVARAGGFTYRASKSKAYVRRAGQTKEILCPLTGQALVRAGDTIRIGERIF